MKRKSEREVAQSCPTLRDPMDRSLPGSSAHGIFQARVLQWGAIAFSEILSTSCQICSKHQGYNSEESMFCYAFVGITVLQEWKTSNKLGY